MKKVRLVPEGKTWQELNYSRCGRTDKGVSALEQVGAQAITATSWLSIWLLDAHTSISKSPWGAFTLQEPHAWQQHALVEQLHCPWREAAAAAASPGSLTLLAESTWPEQVHNVGVGRFLQVVVQRLQCSSPAVRLPTEPASTCK